MRNYDGDDGLEYQIQGGGWRQKVGWNLTKFMPQIDPNFLTV